MHTLRAGVALATLFATAAFAQGPIGCDKFKWPVEKEIAALKAPDLKSVASGSHFSAIPFAGALVPVLPEAANLPKLTKG
jgi:hypothetical protein